MNKPQPLAPHESAEVENKREPRRGNQPYASEVDDRELEHAHRDGRPVQPEGKATQLVKPPR